MLAGNRDDGDDLYHESVCRALPRIGQLRNPEAFRPWLYRIIVNCHRNRVATPWWRRTERIKPEHEQIAGSTRLADPIHARLRLAIAMKPLSTKDRALVLLFDIEGWTIAELAELAGLSNNAVKKRLSRSRKRMKTTLLKYINSRPELNIPGWLEKESDLCVASKRKSE